VEEFGHVSLGNSSGRRLGYTCPLPFLLLTPPNTHRNPNKIICELCLEVEEERKRSRLHILYSHIFISTERRRDKNMMGINKDM
jgi:hypothetical protein